MAIVSIVSITSILGLGIITSITDIKEHKAYNRDLLMFACIGLAIQILSICLGYYDVLSIVANICLAFITAFCFFAARIWAAGDAKLFTVMILLIPRSFYGVNAERLFPAFMVLGFVFTLALFYVLAESLALFMLDFRNRRLGNWKRFLPRPSLHSLLTWALGYVSVSTLNICLGFAVHSDMWQNSNFSIIVSLLLAVAVFSLFETAKSKLILLCICVVARIVMYVTWSIGLMDISPITLLTVLLVILIRSFTSQYNYKTIPTSSVRKGQILAKQSLLLMVPSAVKGLPKWTDESTRCRLDDEEVNAIKRWEHSKYGKSEVTIVRHIPFAPFIFVGTPLYLIIAFYLGV